jgi:solute carrier family 25 S-adenosylmethionine transporter 26
VAYEGVADTVRRLIAESNASHSHSITSLRSLRVLFSGVGPRVMWISIGGFVFFGAYEQVVSLLTPTASAAFD